MSISRPSRPSSITLRSISSPIRVAISARCSTTSTSSSVAAFWNSSAVSRLATWSSRLRYVSSVATAWLVFASTSAIDSSW